MGPPAEVAAFTRSQAVSVRAVKKGGLSIQPMGKARGEGNERKPRGGVGQDDAQLGNVGGTEANTLETVRNVNFG